MVQTCAQKKGAAFKLYVHSQKAQGIYNKLIITSFIDRMIKGTYKDRKELLELNKNMQLTCNAHIKEKHLCVHQHDTCEHLSQ